MSVKNKPENNIESTIAIQSDPNSFYSESFRRIPIGIQLSSVDREPRIIQVTSSSEGDHKTTTSINLAAVYHELGSKVVVIDCDFRRPKLHRAAQVLNVDGLSAYLIDKIDYATLVKKSLSGIDCINVGEKVSHPHIILKSEKLKELFEKLKKDYDYIIVDCPPILPVMDSLIISKLCDTTVFVVNQSKNKKNEVKEAIRQLKESNVNVAGIIFSNVNKRGMNYGKYSYERYRF